MVRCCPSYQTQSVEQKPGALLLLKSQQRTQQLRCQHLADSANHLFSAWTSKRWYLFVYMNKNFAICSCVFHMSRWICELDTTSMNLHHSCTPISSLEICLHPKQGGWHSLCRALEVSQIASFNMFPCLNSMSEIKTLGTGWPETWKISGYFCNQLLEELAPTGRFFWLFFYAYSHIAAGIILWTYFQGLHMDSKLSKQNQTKYLQYQTKCCVIQSVRILVGSFFLPICVRSAPLRPLSLRSHGSTRRPHRDEPFIGQIWQWLTYLPENQHRTQKLYTLFEKTIHLPLRSGSYDFTRWRCVERVQTSHDTISWAECASSQQRIQLLSFGGKKYKETPSLIPIYTTW